MKKNTIITIGREYGSGGRMIGEKLAERLNIHFYDNELIKMAAKKTGYAEEIFEQVDEKPINSLLYSIGTGNFMVDAGMAMITQVPINDKLFVAQCEVIKHIGESGSAVIVGRCADYILRDHANCINVFICADIEDRIRRVKEEYKDDKGNIEARIHKMDKGRASYYNHYSDRKWGKVSNYDITLNSGVGIDACVDVLAKYIELKNK